LYKDESFPRLVKSMCHVTPRAEPALWGGPYNTGKILVPDCGRLADNPIDKQWLIHIQCRCLFTFVEMADEKCDSLSVIIKEQGDLIRSLKLNSAPKEQVTNMLHLNMCVETRRMYNINGRYVRACESDAILLGYGRR